MISGQCTSTQHRNVDKCYTENEEHAVAVMLPELNTLKELLSVRKRATQSLLKEPTLWWFHRS